MKKYMVILLATVFYSSVGTAGEVKLPPITEDTLGNGLTVVAIENHELPVVNLRMIIKSGAAYDPPDKAGLADFTAGLLRKGTMTRTATQVAEAIDFVGGSLSAGADRDAISINCDVLLKHLDVGLEVLSDVILHPAIDTIEIERLRNQTISAIIQSKDDAGTLCTKGFNEILFGSYPYGHPTEGTEKTVAAFTRGDILKYYDTYFHPNNAFLVVSGDIKPSDIFARVSLAFAEWKPADIPALSAPPPPKPEKYSILLIDKPDVTQTNIRFGHIGITREDPDFYPVTLMNYILGVGFVSRLNEEVRVKGGMTYDIRTSNEWNRLPAAFFCSTFTENDSTMSAIRAAIKVIRGMRESEVSDIEYRDAVNFYSGYYPMTLETPSQVAGEIVKIKLYGLPVSYIQDFTQNIQKVTKADILRAAQQHLDPDNMDFCVVSNAAAVADSLKSLGPVTIKKVDELQ